MKLPLENQHIEPNSVDLDLIRELAALLDETGLTEIEVGDGDRRVRVARAAAPTAAVVQPVPQGPIAAAPAEPASSAPGAEGPTVVYDASHPGAVTSPMVGAAYHAGVRCQRPSA